MNKKIISISITLVALVILLGFGLFIMQKSKAPTIAENCFVSSSKNITINYTEAQTFSPACVKITSGAKITWVNQSPKKLEVGADPHPIHTGNKELSNGLFDLEITSGQRSEVTMTKLGTFGYHDHAHAAASGVVVVQ